MGEMYSTASCSHSAATPFLRGLCTPLESKTDFWEFKILNILPVKGFPQVLVSFHEQSEVALGLK